MIPKHIQILSTWHITLLATGALILIALWIGWIPLSFLRPATLLAWIAILYHIFTSKRVL